MEMISDFKDMALSPPKIDGEGNVQAPEAPMGPIYPHGLSICLGDEQLEKLELEDGCEPGDHVRFECIGKVTSVSHNEHAGKRIEIQIVAIACDDDDEGDDSDEGYKPARLSAEKMYGK